MIVAIEEELGIAPTANVFAEEYSAEEGEEEEEEEEKGGGGEREWRCKQAAQNRRATSQTAPHGLFTSTLELICSV